ncbi:MAG: xanthine dehydrogenase accessory factor [Paracoccaceae bacterium]|jgi:xanthine dehydrogenase accessory factor
MQPDHNSIPELALHWVSQGHKIAMATVIETWGSAPRPVGAQLVIREDSEFAGSVSGGCVEAAVVVEALDAIVNGKARVLEFGVSDDEAFAVGLACGGNIRIMVTPVGLGQGPDISVLEQAVAAKRSRVPLAWITDVHTWQSWVSTDQVDPLAGDLSARFRSNKSGFEDTNFVAIHNPPLKLIIVGAVHIAQSLIPMAIIAGYGVTLVDPREAFASATRFPKQTIYHDWPDAALNDIGVDARTAVVTLSHDPKIDDPAILETLKTSAFYLGSLGSRKTHAKRVARLESANIPAAQISRIHAPVGLAIGAKSPAEIAVSILAEITDCLHNREVETQK